MSKKKVYFAASITGGTDPELYKTIVEKLKERFIVLTEHFGVKDIRKYEAKFNHSDEDIYTRDVAWIDECDFVFAEVTRISTGVGYEIGYAEAKGKKVYCVYDVGKVEYLTAMLSGNKNIVCKKYSDKDELLKIIDEIK